MIRRDARGFTIPEVLLTVFIIGVGIAAIMSVIPVGAYGVQEGKQLSTATFLAEQRLEQIRKIPWVNAPAGFPNNAPPANDCLGLGAPPTVPGPTPCFDQTTGAQLFPVGAALPALADENPTAIPGFSGYSRRVQVSACGGAVVCTAPVGGGIDADADMRLVTVTVTYTPLTAQGASPVPKSVSLTMVVAKR
jgi:prepilin-type N-terminal cleavage/methylation domain-containing protein